MNTPLASPSLAEHPDHSPKTPLSAMSTPVTSSSSSVLNNRQCMDMWTRALVEDSSYVSTRMPDPIPDHDLVIVGLGNRNCLVCNTPVPTQGKAPYVDSSNGVGYGAMNPCIPVNNIATNFLHCDGKLIRVHRTCHALAVMFSQEVEEQKSDQNQQMAGELRADIPLFEGQRYKSKTGAAYSIMKTVNKQACSSCPGMVGWNSPFRRCTKCLTETYPDLLQGMSIDRIRETIAKPKQASVDGVNYANTIKRMYDNYHERWSQVSQSCYCGYRSHGMCMCDHEWGGDTLPSREFTEEVRHEAYLIRREKQQTELTTEGVLIPDLANLALAYSEEPVLSHSEFDSKREIAKDKWHNWHKLYSYLHSSKHKKPGVWVYKGTQFPIPNELHINMPADPHNESLSILLESR